MAGVDTARWARMRALEGGPAAFDTDDQDGNSVDSRTETVFTVPMTTYKEATQIQRGDVVMFLGNPHLISKVDPPTESGARLGCYGYAVAADGWSIALYPGTVEVAS